MREKALGTLHPEMGRRYGAFAALRMKQGRVAEAEAFMNQALIIAEKAFGPEHPNLLLPLHALASLHVGRGQFERAEPLVSRASAIAQAALGDEHPSTPNLMERHMEVLEKLGRAEAAQGVRDRLGALRLRQNRRSAAN